MKNHSFKHWLGTAAVAAGLPNGPPESICANASLKPAGHPADFQTGPSNYGILVKPLNKEAGIYRVSVATKDEADTFKGQFIIRS